jgi:hypothetical protein
MEEKPYLAISEISDLMAGAGDTREESARIQNVHRALRAGHFPGAFRVGKGKGGTYAIPAAEAKAWIAAGCPVARAMEQAADETDKRNWHLEEGRLASVAGLDE